MNIRNINQLSWATNYPPTPTLTLENHRWGFPIILLYWRPLPWLCLCSPSTSAQSPAFSWQDDQDAFFSGRNCPPVHILKVCQSCLRFLVNWLNVIVNLINVFSSVLCHPYNTIMTIIMTIMITLTRSLLITSSCSQIVFTMRGSTGLAVTLSMLIGRSIIMMSSASAFEW